jgi:hypothetical protein
VAAWNRDDAEEMRRLWSQSPMLEFRGRDPRTRHQWWTLVLLAHQMYRQLADLSYLVIHVYDHLEPKVRRAGTRRRRVTLLVMPPLTGATGYTADGTVEGQDPKDSEGLPLNRATLRSLSARWKAVSMAVDRFCGDIGLSRARFFELVVGGGMLVRSVVEHVRPCLDARAVADPNQVERIHRAMQSIWDQSVDPH